MKYRIPRPFAHTWLTIGRLGNPMLPHVYGAARANWHLDTKQMKLVELELAVIETRPGGNVLKFAEQLREFRQHVVAKNPLTLMTYADITRSIEAEPLIHRIVPECTVVEVINTGAKAWSLPFMQVGRPLLLSKLSVMLSEHLIASALQNGSDDPNQWNWERVRGALSNMTLRAPKLGEDIMHEDSIEDEVALIVAQLAWNCEADRPEPYRFIQREDQR